MQAADEVPQLSECLLGLVMRLFDDLPGAFRQIGEAGPGHAEIHGQGDQPLLGAVMEIPLEAAALRVRLVHHPGPALHEHLHCCCFAAMTGAALRPRSPPRCWRWMRGST
jgi:hypothetical protein